MIHELPGPLHTRDDSRGCSHAQAHTQCDVEMCLSPQRWAHPHWSLRCALHRRLQTIYALGSSEPPVLCLSVPFSTLSFPSSLPWLASVSCSDAPQVVSGTRLHHLQGPLQVQGSLNKLLGCEHFFPHRIHPLSGWAPLLDFLPGSWQWGLHRAVTR